MKRGYAAIIALAAAVVPPMKDTHAHADTTRSARSRVCDDGPSRQPRPNCAPPAPPTTGNPHEDCVARINQLRWHCQCLPPLKRWRGGEKCANAQAKHDIQRGIHAAFNEDVCAPKGIAQNECPAWPSTAEVVDGCLQAMWDEGPGKRFAKHGHYINMSNPEHDRVACGFAKSPGGEVWSVQNFR